MLIKKIMLNQIDTKWSESNDDAYAELFLLKPVSEIDVNVKYPCVIICPGGGYEFTSSREATQIALRYASQGFSAVVLRYSVAPHKFPTQLCEISILTTFLRRNAQEFNLDINKIAVCGFSAGGHLAASLACLWNLPMLEQKLAIEKGENKPNAAVLCYPVITSGEFAHKGSFAKLLGETPRDDDLKILSLENSVSSNTPPTFIWHTANDASVPVENSLLLAMQLKKHNVPWELHVWPNGMHGLGLADKTTSTFENYHIPHIAKWLEMSVRFLEENM